MAHAHRIAFGWAPDAIARATLVWRRSWNRHFTPAAASAFFQAWIWKLECCSGVPAVVVNTSSSLSTVRSARWPSSSSAVLLER